MLRKFWKLNLKELGRLKKKPGVSERIITRSSGKK
jgi:hypothetical protein